MTKYLLSEGKRVKDIIGAWNKLIIWEKDFKIEDLIEWLCDMKRIHISARILEAVHQSFKPEAVGNCYAEVIYWNLAKLPLHKRDYYWIHFREKQAKRLLRLLKVFIHTENSGLYSRIHFRNTQKAQFVVYHLVRNLPLEELATFYKYLTDCRIRFRVFTILHFIDRLAKEGLYYKGFILMQCMHAEGRTLDTLLCRKAFTLLFSKATRSGNEEASANILKLMLESGLTPDTPIYNVIMYNAVSNRKVDVVLAVYKKMLDQGFEPNEHTFAQLFHLYKKTQDIAQQQQVIHMAMQKYGKISQWMATEIIHATMLQAPKGRRFQSTLGIYNKFFNPGILGLMGLVTKANGSPDLADKMDPDVVVVTIVIQAFLRDESDKNVIWEVYQRYKTLRESEEHGAFFELQPIIANHFIYALSSNIHSMVQAIDVMQDLEAPSLVRWRLKTRPNRYSWSILAKAFTKHGRLNEAKSILRTMLREGFEPVEVSWELLLSAYLKAGKAEEAGETLGLMLTSGVKIRGQTLHMFLSDENKEGIAKGLEKVTRAEKKQGLQKEVSEAKLSVDHNDITTTVGNNWEAAEEERRIARQKHTQELQERQKKEGYDEKERPPILDGLSVDDI